MLLPEIGESGQQRLKDARVLVIGAGGLGCPVLQYLATAGVGTLGIIDFDVVELHNLHRQILYREVDVNQPKALIAELALKQLNPEIRTIVFNEKLT